MRVCLAAEMLPILSTGLLAAGTTGAPSWRSFAGTNYGGGVGMPDVSRADLGFVRDPLGPPWLWSEWPVVGYGPSPQPSYANVTAVRGPFTGQFVYMDFAGTARGLKVRYYECLISAGSCRRVHVRCW